MIDTAVFVGDLPEFDAPPVVELAVAVQFDQVKDMSIAHLGLLWSAFRGDFPEVKVHPPLGTVREIFGPPRRAHVEMQLEGGAPEVRLWFCTEDGTRVVQVQRDRMVFNWRKRNEAAYPRYSRLREEFIERFTQFERFLRVEGLGPIVPNQVELTYVNNIPVLDDRWGSPDQYVRLWRAIPADAWTPRAELAEFQTQFVLPSGTEPLGRLHVHLQPRLSTSDGSLLYQLRLTGRGAPRGQQPDLPSVLELLDHEHVWIVRGFTDITTEEMHALWQRRR